MPTCRASAGERSSPPSPGSRLPGRSRSRRSAACSRHLLLWGRREHPAAGHRDRPRGQHGYRHLLTRDGEPHFARLDLIGQIPDPARETRRRSILYIGHLSNMHLMDAQSPARLEPMIAQDHSTWASAFHPHETLTTHVAAAMVTSIADLRISQATGRPARCGSRHRHSADMLQPARDPLVRRPARRRADHAQLRRGGRVRGRAGVRTRPTTRTTRRTPPPTRSATTDSRGPRPARGGGQPGGRRRRPSRALVRGLRQPRRAVARHARDPGDAVRVRGGRPQVLELDRAGNGLRAGVVVGDVGTTTGRTSWTAGSSARARAAVRPRHLQPGLVGPDGAVPQRPVRLAARPGSRSAASRSTGARGRPQPPQHPHARERRAVPVFRPRPAEPVHADEAACRDAAGVPRADRLAERPHPHRTPSSAHPRVRTGQGRLLGGHDRLVHRLPAAAAGRSRSSTTATAR